MAIRRRKLAHLCLSIREKIRRRSIRRFTPRAFLVAKPHLRTRSLLLFALSIKGSVRNCFFLADGSAFSLVSIIAKPLHVRPKRPKEVTFWFRLSGHGGGIKNGRMFMGVSIKAGHSLKMAILSRWPLAR